MNFAAAKAPTRRVFAERFRSAPSPETAALAESLRGEVAASPQPQPRRTTLRGV